MFFLINPFLCLFAQVWAGTEKYQHPSHPLPCPGCLVPQVFCEPLLDPNLFLSPQLGEGLGAKETPQQRYQRLQHEVQELVREVEQIQVSIAPGMGVSGEVVAVA